MKRILIAALLCSLLFSLKLSAQDRPYRFGLFLSPNISWLKPEVEEEVYTSDGSPVYIGYGASFEYDFTPNIGLITGINVLQTGGKLKYRHIQENSTTAGVMDTGILSRKYNVHYLEIPIMLKGSTGELLGNFSFFGKFGIGNGFNFRAKATDVFTNDNGGDAILKENVNVKKDMSFFRESMIIGIGAEYRLGKTAIVHMGLTFSNGFTNVLKGYNTFTPAAKEKARSNFMELTIGMLF